MPDFSWRKPEDCPSPSYHETHMYCPDCSFVHQEPKSDFDAWWENEGLIRTYHPGSPQAKMFDDMFKEVAKKAWDAARG